jgi:hypothetical protein
MKIFICASKHLYGHVAPIKKTLEERGHVVTLPNSYDNPGKENEMMELSADEHRRWKADMLRAQGEKVACNDAILVLNMEKNGQKNYIGGATFLEIFKAFELGKKIFLFNPIPDNFLKDELLGMGPVVIDGKLELVA